MTKEELEREYHRLKAAYDIDHRWREVHEPLIRALGAFVRDELADVTDSN